MADEIETLDGQRISLEPAPDGGVLMWVEEPDGRVQGYVLTSELAADLANQLAALPPESGE